MNGATLRPSSSGTQCSSTAAPEPLRTSSLERREADQHAALHVGHAGPEGALALDAHRPRGGRARREDGVVVAEQQRPPAARAPACARRRAARPARAEGRRRSRPRAPSARSASRRRRAPRGSPSASRSRTAGAGARGSRGRRGGHAGNLERRGLGGAQQRQAPARHPRQHAPGLDAQPALEQRGVDACGSRS